MGRGRPRKPLAELKLHGGYRHNEHGGRSEPQFEGHPERPDFTDGSDSWNAAAAWFWDFHVTELTQRKVLTHPDTVAFRTACEAWATYQHILKLYHQASKENPGECPPRPLMSTLAESRKLYDQAASKLGLSPVDRTHVHSEEPEDDSSGLAAFNAELA